MQLKTEQLNSYTRIYYAEDGQESLQYLGEYIEMHREDIMQQLHQNGILLFRGFRLTDPEQFSDLVQNTLKFEPWNAFNPNLPGWIASLMRKYSENILGAGDYRRYIDRNVVQLGPVENSVQGPHVEGGVRSERSRYISLFCQEPSTYLAETGFNNLEQVWESLPTALQQKYLGAWNHFSYVSARKVNFIDRILLKYSPFQVEIRQDKKAKLTLKPCPLVVMNPDTQKPVLQPWAFAHNTNPFAYQAAKNQFQHRGEIEIDSTANGMQLTWEIYTPEGQRIEWNDEEKQQFFDALYCNALLLQWQKGDFAIVDNIKIAHWRMNGEQGNRKLIQIQANAFNADEHAAI